MFLILTTLFAIQNRFRTVLVPLDAGERFFPPKKEKDEYKSRKVKTIEHTYEKYVEVTVETCNFFVSFCFFLLLSTFWIGPPDKLAEALIFTCKLKSHSRINQSCAGAPRRKQRGMFAPSLQISLKKTITLKTLV
ncbi:MAG: hypothetical protein PHF18_14060 [Methanosarcina sp.]|uniref:hypothetical protein n=1 Tax=Methanosarcina sp. TaxID=2213 RepID=UPI0026242E1F|nr:hypothetical protein [Methanosarcina sp.]MDD3247951.1 hypothetical protein [Methanosarcina sp.]MDD4249261.1 hypothetical protein [Methanosarcina sp.]